MSTSDEKSRPIVDAVRILPIDSLQVDHSYQRDLKDLHVRRIAAEFLPFAFQTPTVGLRADGSFWIVDGQQRIAAVKILGWKEVRCAVCRSSGPEEEAHAYVVINMRRKKLNSAEDFKALLAHSDQMALAVEAAVKGAGFRLNLSQSGRRIPDPTAKSIACVATLCRVYNMCSHTTDAIAWMLPVIHAWQPNNALALGNAMVLAFAIFWNRQEGDIDNKRLLRWIKGISENDGYDPKSIITKARDLLNRRGKSETGSLSASIADVLEGFYQKRIKR